ncbi:Alpha/Beta hydrolase protein [Mycena galericulata]|nr:Alpha/Beta hydrolase protein [Mycena galericulata]
MPKRISKTKAPPRMKFEPMLAPTFTFARPAVGTEQLKNCARTCAGGASSSDINLKLAKKLVANDDLMFYLQVYSVLALKLLTTPANALETYLLVNLTIKDADPLAAVRALINQETRGPAMRGSLEKARTALGAAKLGTWPVVMLVFTGDGTNCMGFMLPIDPEALKQGRELNPFVIKSALMGVREIPVNEKNIIEHFNNNFYMDKENRYLLHTLTSNLGPVVDLGYAAYAGNTTSPTGIANGTVAFYGNIRYAEPPSWTPETGAQLASNTQPWWESGAKASSDSLPGTLGSEPSSTDCLTLNVWKPTNASTGDALPVAVYIHGGGFYYGSPQGFPMYDWVAQHPGGIIGVSITYRLTLLGFLGGPAVAADGDLNAGLLDQRAGLEWIQRHISQFAAIPETSRFTGRARALRAWLFRSWRTEVRLEILGSKPLTFKRATAQSIGFGPANTAEMTDAFFTNATEFIGCPASGSDTMPCLRNASVDVYIPRAIVSAINRIGIGAFAPIIEGPGGFLPDLPSRLIATGKFSDVEFVGGHCTGDGKYFANLAGGSPDNIQTDGDIRRIIFSHWTGVSNATIDRALAIYPEPNVTGSPFATQWDRASAMVGEIIFTCMDWFLSETLTSKGLKNVFAYSWDAPDTVLFNATPFLGAMHTSDLYFLFDGTK